MAVFSVQAHNLQTKMNWMYFDPATQDYLDQLLADRLTDGDPSNDASPVFYAYDPAKCDATTGICTSDGTPTGTVLGLSQASIIIKVVPQDGTTTGVGGYIDFYVPNGTQVVDVGYVIPDGSGGYTDIPMKGQSLIAVGDGPVGTNCTSELGTPTPHSLGPNYNGITADTVDASGCHEGTIAGVYGDVGVFYSTDPDTSYSSWNAAPRGKCGLADIDPDAPNGIDLVTNNSGDSYSACNKWDIEQLHAWGMSNPLDPIIDPNGRGNAPWGTASGVAGPQSGYEWAWDMDEWNQDWFSVKLIPVRDGKLDIDDNGTADDGVAGDGIEFRGLDVIGGLVDFNGNGVIDGLDDGSDAGWRYIDGYLDLDTDGVAGTVGSPAMCDPFTPGSCADNGDNGIIREHTYDQAEAADWSLGTGKTTGVHTDLRDAMIDSITTGPFQRIKYPYWCRPAIAGHHRAKRWLAQPDSLVHRPADRVHTRVCPGNHPCGQRRCIRSLWYLRRAGLPTAAR
jgi:hypothetical protein